jgi:hypothetical protein
MKTFILFASVVCLTAAAPSTPALAAEPQHDHVTGGPAQPILDQAKKAMTPAARDRLMQENMAAMKAQMTEMHVMMADEGNMADKPMAMGMPMHADHMAKMHKHMTMMHDMMARLILQQELLMKTTR